MTRKLYYEDCHMSRFTARVLDCRKDGRGYLVTLDATAFYPEGGGQPCDLGVLGGVNVLDVQERGQEVVHLCDGPLAVGDTVEGQIQWERRFDLMQQHTGEHMVSGVVCARYGYHNVGFHMGADVITIDFDGILPAQALPEIEAEVNRRIWENIPVKCWIPSEQELPRTYYRTKRALSWPVRLVEIAGVDSCACCGVHVERTGEIGLVKLLSCVKFHQGVRIELVCGGRAVALLNQVYEQARQVSQAFSAKLPTIGEAARRMNERLTAAEYRVTQLERQSFDGVAAGYAGQGDVVHFHEGLDANGIRELADRIAQQCGGTAAVFSSGEQGYMICLVNKNGDVRELGNALKEKLGARGGGKPGYFQGSVQATEAQIRELFGAV